MIVYEKNNKKITSRKYYREEKKKLEKEIERVSECLDDSIAVLENLKRAQYPINSTKYQQELRQYYRWSYLLNKNNLSLKFIRPNNKDDIEYRSQMHSDLFVYQLQNIIAPNGTPLMDLRFHGTPIYFAQQIIETGSITSSMDRFGNYNNSTNINGEISTSRIHDLKRAMDLYSDMIGYKSCMPAGCVFAVFPRDYEDSIYGVDTMHNIDFRKNPQQLFGIFTTPENIKQVKGWMSEYGFNPDLVYNFEEFLKATQMAVLNITNNQILNEGETPTTRLDTQEYGHTSRLDMQRLTLNALQNVHHTDIIGMDNRLSRRVNSKMNNGR